MEQSRTEIVRIPIRQYYTKDDDGIVWWHYQLSGHPWVVQRTAFTELPWVEVEKG